MIYQLCPTRVYRAYYGGANIDRLEGNPNPAVSRFPEDWISSVTAAFNPGRNMEKEGLSQTVDGEYLKDLIEADRTNMIGQRKEMSFLFKLLDASERLAIQAHPTVPFARKYFNSSYGKTECWYILNDGGCVYLGFKEGITKEYWKHLFDVQDIEGMLECMHHFPVKRGDLIYVAGGVPHAIGAGCFLAEIQEPTDLMVIPERVTPSGVRLAEEKLHGGLGFEKMFDCFEYGGLSAEETKKRYFRKPLKRNNVLQNIIDRSITDKFQLDQLIIRGDYRYEMPSYGVILVIEGKGTIGAEEVRTGDRMFLSETEKGIELSGSMQVILCRP